MFIGGTILDLLPWVFIAPALPLLFILIKKAYGNERQTSLVILCVITILTNLFLVIASRSEIEPEIVRACFIADFIFTMILLRTCTPLVILKHSILAALVIFSAVYACFHLYNTATKDLFDLNIAGTSLVFIVAVIVLFSIASRVDRHILSMPGFWYSGGIFIHFGLLSLMLITARRISDIDYHNKDQYSILYGIIFCLQFLFFCIGIYVHKPWTKRSGLL